MRALALVMLVGGFLLVRGGLTQPDTAELGECARFEETDRATLFSLGLAVFFVAW